MTSTRNGTRDAIHVRVDAVERDVGHIEKQVDAIRDAMVTKADMSALLSRIDGLTTQQNASARPNWAALGVAVAFLGILGAALYSPINAATNDLKTAVVALADKAVFQRQYEADNILARNDRASIRADLAATATSGIQQQRYNTDKTARDDEIKILRERFEKVMSRSEFDSQHGDLKTFIQALLASRDRQLLEMTGRIVRLEDTFFKK